MRSYEEVTNHLLKRRDCYVAEQNRKRKRILEVAAALGCVCLVAMMGVGVWRSGIGTFPPSSDGPPQLNNTDTQDHTSHTNMESTAGNVDAKIWMSAQDVLKSAQKDTQQMGVAVPMVIAYQGAVYGFAGEEDKENSQYAPLETQVVLQKNYAYSAYHAKDVSDSVAIVMNGKLMIYQKLFEVNAVMDGTAYSIVHSMAFDNRYAAGNKVQENEEFAVYQAVNKQSGEVIESEYLINILPLLQKEYPNMFNQEENYGDAWWVAVPQTNG